MSNKINFDFDPAWKPAADSQQEDNEIGGVDFNYDPNFKMPSAASRIAKGLGLDGGDYDESSMGGQMITPTEAAQNSKEYAKQEQAEFDKKYARLVREQALKDRNLSPEDIAANGDSIDLSEEELKAASKRLGYEGMNRNFQQIAGDLSLSGVAGVKQLAKAGVDLVAPASETAQYLNESIADTNSRMSPEMRQQLEWYRQQIKDAEAQGRGAEFAEAFGNLSPQLAAHYMANTLPSMAPVIGVGKVAQGLATARGATAAGAALAGARGAGVANAALNAGGARGDAFEELKQTYMEKGASEDQAIDLALSDSWIPAGAGSVTGYVGGRFGAESDIIRDSVTTAAKFGVLPALKAVVGSLFRELTTEQAEELLPKITTNLLAEKDPLDGIAEVAAQTFAGSVGMGSVGAASAGREAYRSPLERELQGFSDAVDGTKFNPAGNAEEARRAASGMQPLSVSGMAELQAMRQQQQAQPPAPNADEQEENLVAELPQAVENQASEIPQQADIDQTELLNQIEALTQPPEIAAPSIPVVGPLSAAANVAVKTGAAAQVDAFSNRGRSDVGASQPLELGSSASLNSIGPNESSNNFRPNAERVTDGFNGSSVGNNETNVINGESPSVVQKSHSLSQESIVSKTPRDSVGVYIERIRDLLGSKPSVKQGLDVVDGDFVRMVQRLMIAAGKDFKVRDAIIKSIPVDVMDVLRSKQISPDMLFDDPSVLKNIFSWSKSDDSIPLVVNPASSILQALTTKSAEKLFRSSDLVRVAINQFSASGAANSSLHRNTSIGSESATNSNTIAYQAAQADDAQVGAEQAAAPEEVVATSTENAVEPQSVESQVYKHAFGQVESLINNLRQGFIAGANESELNGTDTTSRKVRKHAIEQFTLITGDKKTATRIADYLLEDGAITSEMEWLNNGDIDAAISTLAKRYGDAAKSIPNGDGVTSEPPVAAPQQPTPAPVSKPISERETPQLIQLAKHGLPGKKEEAIAELARRGVSIDPPVQLDDTNAADLNQVPDSPTEIKQEEAKPVQGSSTVRSNLSPIQRRDDLVGAIMRVTGGSGISAGMAQTIVGDTANNATKVRGLFTNAGVMDLDDTADLLRNEEGYDVRDGNHLAELIREQAAGNPVYSSARIEREAAKEEEKKHREEVLRRAKKYGVRHVARPFSETEDEVFRIMEERHIKAVQMLDDRSFTRFSAMLDAAQRIVSYEDLDAIVTDAHNRFEGRKVWDEVRKQIRAHISDLVQAEKLKRQEGQNDAIEIEGQPDGEPDWISDGQPTEGSGSGSAVDRINEAGEGEATPEGSGGSQEEFSLVAQSEDDVRAQERQREDADSDRLTKEQVDRERDAVPFSLAGQSQPRPQGVQVDMIAADGRISADAAQPADQPRAETVTAPAEAEASQSPKDQGAAAFKSGAERKAPEGLSIADKARWLGGYDDAKAEADQNPIKNETPAESTPLADNEAQNQEPIKNEAAVSVQSTTIESRGATWRIDVHPSAWVPGEMAWSGYKRNAGGEFVKVESDDIPAGVAKKAAEFFDSVVNPASDLLDQVGDAAVDAENAQESKRDELQARIEDAAQKTNHDATPAQKEAGNYAKGKFAWNGLTISVETAKGEDRTDKETNGDKWRVTMPATYGYILGTKGADKDHVDLFMGDNPESESVFVVNQNQVDSQKFDEHKVMAGFASAKDAQAAYIASFEDGFGDRVFGSITGPYSIKEFREMLDAGKFEKPQSIGAPISPLSMIDVQLDGETMSAEQAIKDIDDQLSLADKLLNCVTK